MKNTIVGCGTPGTGDFKYCEECAFEHDPDGCRRVQEEGNTIMVHEDD